MEVSAYIIKIPSAENWFSGQKKCPGREIIKAGP